MLFISQLFSKKQRVPLIVEKKHKILKTPRKKQKTLAISSCPPSIFSVLPTTGSSWFPGGYVFFCFRAVAGWEGLVRCGGWFGGLFAVAWHGKKKIPRTELQLENDHLRKNMISRFFRVTLLGVWFVTFSGVKTWPPFGWSKGHLEEAGVVVDFSCLGYCPLPPSCPSVPTK